MATDLLGLGLCAGSKSALDFQCCILARGTLEPCLLLIVPLNTHISRLADVRTTRIASKHDQMKFQMQWLSSEVGRFHEYECHGKSSHRARLILDLLGQEGVEDLVTKRHVSKRVSTAWQKCMQGEIQYVTFEEHAASVYSYKQGIT